MHRANYRFEKKFPTKVYDGKKYLGKNYSAYLKKKMIKDIFLISKKF